MLSETGLRADTDTDTETETETDKRCSCQSSPHRRVAIAAVGGCRNRRRNMNFKHGQVNWRPTSRPTPCPLPMLIPMPMPTVKRTSDRPQSVATLRLPFCRADISNVCLASQICMPTASAIRTQRQLRCTVQKQCVLSVVTAQVDHPSY